MSEGGLGELLAQGQAAGLPPNIVLMRLILAADDPADIAALLDRNADAGEVARLWRETPEAYRLVRDLAAAVDHSAPTGRRVDFGVAFDRAFARHPVASAALYTLGRVDLAVRRIVEVENLLDRMGAIDARARIVEIGCGTGDLARRLASRCAAYLGLDLSEAMLAAARRACRKLPNAGFRLTGERPLAGLTPRSADLVLAVDCFPYLTLAGPERVAVTLNDAGRILAPDGAVVIMNYRYDLPRVAAEAELARLAAGAGLGFAPIDARFSVWDAAVYRLSGPASSG